MDGKRAADAIRWNVQPFVNGRYKPSASKESFDNINPATENALCTIPAGSPEDSDDAVCIAREGCGAEIWSVRGGEMLIRLADLIGHFP